MQSRSDMVRSSKIECPHGAAYYSPRCTRYGQPRKRGFTLIEILVTVTILAIAATVAIPYISSSFADLKLSAAARAVLADLLYAQSQAIATQKNVYLIFTVGSGSTPDQYELRSSTGTPPLLGPVMLRPAGAPGIVTLGKSTALLPDAKLGTAQSPSYVKIGFDSLGQPFTFTSADNASGTAVVPTPQVTQINIPLKSPTGVYTTTLSIQPFTGEITVQ